jgi:hypothetical protein
VQVQVSGWGAFIFLFLPDNHMVGSRVITHMWGSLFYCARIFFGISFSLCVFFFTLLCPMNTFSRAVGWHVRTPFSSNFYLLRIILWHGNFLVAVGPWKKIIFILEIELCCVFRHRWFGLVWSGLVMTDEKQ